MTREVRREFWSAVALLAVLAVAAFSWRVGEPVAGGGRALRPRPDALEYVAGAQAIAQEGRYFLQVGPRRVPPRYPPGWSLLLALALRAGVDPRELWRLNAVIDSAFLLLAGTLAAGLLLALATERTSSRRRRAALAVTVTVAAISLGASSGRWLIARHLFSEPAAAFFALMALALAAVGLLGRLGRARRGLSLVAAGATGALAFAIRPADGALAACGGVALAVTALSVEGVRSLGRRLALLIAGALPVLGGVSLLMMRSGRAPWQWSAYSYWVPFYRSVDRWLDSSWLVGPGPRFDEAGILWAARVLAALPGLGVADRMVPGAALALLLALAVVIARRRPAGTGFGGRVPLVVGSIAAAATWFVAHTFFYGAYLFHYQRFLYAPAVLLAAGGALAAGFAVLAGSRKVCALAGLLATAVVVISLVGAFETGPIARNQAAIRDPYRETAKRVARWRRLSKRHRANAAVAFDPLLAQAFGLLSTREAAQQSWGSLPLTEHVLRLRMYPALATRSVDTPGDGD